jgi:6-phosphogluconolactonase/glucosamine-6-phosphate isomerase/deaminase
METWQRIHIFKNKDEIFLVTGETKAAVLGKIIDQHDASMPAAHVHPKSGNLLFLIDREASVKLDKEWGGLVKTR